MTTFGPYVDTYTIEQAVADGATVPIYYESRLAELRIVGHTLDALFEQVFADRTDAERQAIKARYANEQALAGAPRRVEAICLDLVEHFRGAIAPGGFKAQVVACSREVAVAYHETLLRLQGPQSAVIISASNQDPERLVRHHTTEDQKKALILRFLTPEDPLQILVVCDMLLTGFDAPVEQVMYLDAPLREHALLQAIARVNRTAEHKTYGLVVDYWGVSQALTEALAIFAPGDVQGALTPKDDELPRLQARHAAVRRFLSGVKDPDDLQACVAVLEPEDVRARFDEAWKRFAQSLDLVLPDPRGVPYLAEARWLGKIRHVAAATYRDGKLDISDCGAKVRRLIEEAVAAEGIQILISQVALFAPEFEEKLAKLRTGEARASEMEHALRHEIHVRLDEDPVFYASLRERLETIIAERKAARLDAAQQLELLGLIRSEVRGHAQAAEQVGLSETGYAIYGLLHGSGAGRAAEPEAEPYGDVDEARRALAQLIEEQVEPQVGLVDWARKDDVQKEMRRRIKRQLRAAGYREETLDPTAETVVDLYKARRRR